MIYRSCTYDSDGYCTKPFRNRECGGSRLQEEHRKICEGDVEVCYSSVLTHWLFCMLCPGYMPAEGEEAERILGDRWVECINGRLVLVGPEESLSDTA